MNVLCLALCSALTLEIALLSFLRLFNGEWATIDVEMLWEC